MFVKIISRLEEAIISLLLVATTLLVFVEVLLRFGFNTGLLWAEELTLYLAAWFVLFGVSYGIKVGAHIGVDAFVRLLPNTPQRIVGLMAVSLSLVYCGLFLYGGWVYLAKMKMIGIEMNDLPFPKWIAMSILFTGFVMLTLRLLELFWRILKGQQLGFEQADEAEESLQLADQIQIHLAEVPTHPPQHALHSLKDEHKE